MLRMEAAVTDHPHQFVRIRTNLVEKRLATKTMATAIIANPSDTSFGSADTVLSET